MNTELLRDTLAHIDANRAEWRQSNWRMCFAAHAALLAGGRWATEPGGPVDFLLKPDSGDAAASVVVADVDGRQVRGVPVAARAARVLGLSEAQAERLFLPGNDLPLIHLIVSELIEEAA
ncbi:hypothetical protein [Nonomuraea sp. NPDC023979]|uniref:hypothetical protein n=1 Tax=Nonomuraea sp. NPDC023979 TaxID=3154796 RepID=UPI0033CBF29D